MDLEKELAGWSHSKSCGQQLDVQVESNNEQCCERISTGTRALVFVGNMDSGINCTFSKFADNTKQQSTYLEGKATIQKDLDRLKGGPARSS